jgi:hypothetical protein
MSERANVVAEVLERAASQFDTLGLSRGSWAKRADGSVCDELAPDAACVCAVGAIRRAWAAMEPREVEGMAFWVEARMRAVEELRRHVYGSGSILVGSLAAWSDRADDADAVALTMRRCASLVRAV